MTGDPHMVLHPAVLPVDPALARLAPGQRGRALGRHARRALALSARHAGLALGPLDKDDRGAPVATGGVHWSVSHKPSMVAAVAAQAPVGIDIEQVRPLHPGVPQRIASGHEWDLAGTSRQAVFCMWTAKEAVLKAEKVGLAGLAACRLVAAGNDRWTLRYADRKWTVQHRWLAAGHLAAVAWPAHTRATVCWHCEDEPRLVDQGGNLPTETEKEPGACM